MVKLHSVLGSPPGSGWGVFNASISDSCLGKEEADIPVFCLLLLFEQVPTPEGKQHTGGGGSEQRLDQPSPQTGCQSWIRLSERSHRGPRADTTSSARAGTVTEEGGGSGTSGSGLACRPQTHVVEAPPVKGRQRLCGAKLSTKFTHNPLLKIYERGKRTVLDHRVVATHTEKNWTVDFN